MFAYNIFLYICPQIFAQSAELGANITGLYAPCASHYHFLNSSIIKLPGIGFP